MKKVIIQIYNNLQVLWSSKVKFVLLSQLLGCPSLGPTLVFSLFQVLLSHLWGLKKKTEGRRDIKGEREGIEQERRKERKKVLKEKQLKIIIIKNFFLNASCWLQTGQASVAGLFGRSRLRVLSLALLGSNQHWASL